MERPVEHKSSDPVKPFLPDEENNQDFAKKEKPGLGIPANFTPNYVIALQKTVGNSSVQRMIAKRAERMSAIAHRDSTIQRALVAGKMVSEPTYNDGLTLPVIESTAVDKEVIPAERRDKKKWMRQNGKGAGLSSKSNPTPSEITAEDILINQAMNVADTAHQFLKTGDVHGNQVYKNKSGDLPAGPAYKEYDITKYTRGTNRGGLRVVIGNTGGVKTYFYTANHYVDFQEFSPASATPVATPVVATPTVSVGTSGTTP